jgi:hypothetical protein
MPISPQSALVALSLAGDDEDALRSLSQSLITTIQKHTKEVRLTNEAKDTRTAKLEQTLGGFLLTSVTPAGYKENNNSHTPHFTIPIQDNYYQLAYWVKQLDNRQVAAYPKDYTIADQPTIGDLYAHLQGADNSNDDPILPMQPWLLELLTGPTNNYNMLYKEVQGWANWKMLAEVQCFREHEHTILDVQWRIDFLQAESQGHLEAAHLDRATSNLHTLPT